MSLCFFIIACSGIKGEEENSQEIKENRDPVISKPTVVKVVKVEHQTSPFGLSGSVVEGRLPTKRYGRFKSGSTGNCPFEKWIEQC